jgi:hypothetical protein
LPYWELRPCILVRSSPRSSEYGTDLAGARNPVWMLVVGVDLLAAEGRWGRRRRKSGRRGSWGWSAVGKEEEEEGGL